MSPSSLGNAGGSLQPYSFGGNGGDYILITTSGVVQVDGIIAANGNNGTGSGGGGGSGGPISLSAGSLLGSGSITANGGAGANSIGGGGGGGRIYIVPKTNFFTGPISAYGGGGANWAEQGPFTCNDQTIPPAHPGQCRTWRDQYSGPNSEQHGFNRAQWRSWVRPKRSGFRQFVCLFNAWLVWYYNNSLPAQSLYFSIIGNHDRGRRRTGREFFWKRRRERIRSRTHFILRINQLWQRRGTRGHGRQQLRKLWIGRKPYDTFTSSAQAGSGGGTSSPQSPGGAGGGIIELIVSGALELDGIISANGGNGSGVAGGGGSGGSIWLGVTGAISGAGTVSANGGSGAGSLGGGGGGGMIYVSCNNNLFSGT